MVNGRSEPSCSGRRCAQRGGTHAGHGADALLDALLELRQRRAGPVLRLGQRQLHRQDLIDGDARTRGLKLGEALHEQEGANGEHQRERDLAGDEHAPHPAAAATNRRDVHRLAACRRAAAAPTATRAAARRPDPRRTTGRAQTTSTRQSTAMRSASGTGCGLSVSSMRHTDVGQRDAGETAHRREQRALDQQLSHDRSGASAERGAQRHLRPALRGRASCRFATFTHAMSSTKPTAPSRISSARGMLLP